MTDNYADILTQSWDSIPEPKTLPGGSWRLKAKGASFKEGDGTTSARAMFIYEPKEAMDDVDATALEDLGEDYDVSANLIFYTVWIETARDWDTVRKHLAKHDPKLLNMPIGESFKKVRGTEINAYLGQRTYTNKAGELVEENTASQFVAVDA